jgi:hypothetical protein
MNRHEFLKTLHVQLQPRTYLETGVADGRSLSLSRVPSIGIDPDYNITAEQQADIHLARTTSDEFFARQFPLAHLPVPVLDLAFIDGMHLSEYAMRDYLAVERFTTAASVIVVDDMLPRSIDEAARRRHTNAWTGDVFKVTRALRKFCPELIVLEVNTRATGVVVILAPNAGRGGVLKEYDAWMDEAMAPDPQDVPEQVLTRSAALDPETLLASPAWAGLVTLRNSGAKATSAAVHALFAEFVPA